MRPTPIWAASSSHPTATGRSGGGAACARLASLTGGRQESTIAQQEELPLQDWQSSLPLQRPGPQPPRGDRGVGLGGQWG